MGFSRFSISRRFFETHSPNVDKSDKAEFEAEILRVGGESVSSFIVRGSLFS